MRRLGHFERKTLIIMVLIIHTSKSKARAIGDIFYYMGVISYATTPQEAMSEISDRYRAVLIVDPELLPDAKSYADKLRSYNPYRPVFAISDTNTHTLADIFDGVYPNNIYSSRLIEEIVRFQVEHGLPITTQYRLAGIDASCNAAVVSVFDRSVLFTKTETMILRYMIAAYPTPADAKSILKYAFKPLRKPEEASIRTHVSVMNKKFKKVRNRSLFHSIPGEGYVILTPEIQKSIRDAELIKT